LRHLNYVEESKSEISSNYDVAEFDHANKNNKTDNSNKKRQLVIRHKSINIESDESQALSIRQSKWTTKRTIIYHRLTHLQNTDDEFATEIDEHYDYY